MNRRYKRSASQFLTRFVKILRQIYYDSAGKRGFVRKVIKICVDASECAYSARHFSLVRFWSGTLNASLIVCSAWQQESTFQLDGTFERLSDRRSWSGRRLGHFRKWGSKAGRFGLKTKPGLFPVIVSIIGWMKTLEISQIKNCAFECYLALISLLLLSSIARLT